MVDHPFPDIEQRPTHRVREFTHLSSYKQVADFLSGSVSPVLEFVYARAELVEAPPEQVGHCMAIIGHAGESRTFSDYPVGGGGW